jgi:hypothetical protein
VLKTHGIRAPLIDQKLAIAMILSDRALFKSRASIVFAGTPDSLHKGLYSRQEWLY